MTLSVPFGVKVDLLLDEVEEIKNYIASTENKDLLINDQIRVKFLKGDVKERKGKATFIFRYEYQGGLY